MSVSSMADTTMRKEQGYREILKTVIKSQIQLLVGKKGLQKSAFHENDLEPCADRKYSNKHAHRTELEIVFGFDLFRILRILRL